MTFHGLQVGDMIKFRLAEIYERTGPVMVVFERHCVVNLDTSLEYGIPYVVRDINFIERIP